ncbi:EF-hand calcium-binding domain-containing protein 8 [Ambystoma mexicanum]|uniref:EF-hand calcium-binding domain-containing protein 8 n=1 Tax=Ambystoma mexicanum TaxID=8296 RepID=UPI0037E913F8
MKRILGNVEDQVLDIIFKKVDSESHGSVDWAKYLNYLLKEYKGKARMHKPATLLMFPKPMQVIPVAHAEAIVKVEFFLNRNRGSGRKGMQEEFVESDMSTGRFLTISKDGILNYWSEDFKLLRTVHLDQTKKRHSRQMWVMDMVGLFNLNLLAVASVDRDIGTYMLW